MNENNSFQIPTYVFFCRIIIFMVLTFLRLCLKSFVMRVMRKFIESIGEDSIAIIPAAHEATRIYHTEYKFRQDSDFLYLTGFPEPDAIAVIEPRSNKPYTLFVRPRDLEMETWFGRREGVDGAVKNYKADRAVPVDKFGAELGKLLDATNFITGSALTKSSTCKFCNIFRPSGSVA